MVRKAKSRSPSCKHKTSSALVSTSATSSSRGSPHPSSFPVKLTSTDKTTPRKKKCVRLVDLSDELEGPVSSEQSLETDQCSTDSNPVPSWLKLARAYRGFCPFESSVALQDDPIPRIPYTSITPKDFYYNYVVRRRPCILTTTPDAFASHAGLQELQPLLTQWAGDGYLETAAGLITWSVDKRLAAATENSGSGPAFKLPTYFPKVVPSTNQAPEGPAEDEGPGSYEPCFLTPSLLTSTPIILDYPSVPSVLKNLIPFQYNLWVKDPQEQPSSGLRHDFHDHLYIMIRGLTRFRLFSPRCAELLPVPKPIARIHPNGLIAYDCATRSDGVNPSAVAHWRIAQAKNQVRILQLRLHSLQRACKILRYYIRYIRQPKGPTPLRRKRPFAGTASKQKPRLVKGAAAPKGSGHLAEKLVFAQTKLASVVTEGFLAELQRVKLKQAKLLLEQEFQSRMESVKLIKLHITEAIQRSLQLESEYHKTKMLQNGKTTAKEGGPAHAVANVETRSSLKMPDEDAPRHQRGAPRTSRRAQTTAGGTEDQPLADIKSPTRRVNGGTNGSPNDRTDSHDADALRAEGYRGQFCLDRTITRDPLSGPLPLAEIPCSSDEADEATASSASQKRILQNYLEVSVQPGEMLYLPAGWFYEMLSESPATKASPQRARKPKKGSKGPAPQAMAFTYRFFPPHVGYIPLSGTTGHDVPGAFENPYQDSFCRKKFDMMERYLWERRTMFSSFV